MRVLDLISRTRQWLCSVLALAVLIIIRVVEAGSARSSDDSATLLNFRIFDGAHSEGRFSEILVRTNVFLSDTDRR